MSKVEMPESSLNFPSNSNISKEERLTQQERPKMKKVIKGKVVTKKPSFGHRFAELFFGEEIADVKGYILQDVIIPSIKDTISDVVSGGLDMLLFGEHRARGRSRSTGPYTSYGSYYSGSKPQSRSKQSGGYSSSRYYVKEIICETRGEAEEILGNMIDAIKDYGMISVAELYEMIGEPGQFTDHSWGWFDLGSSSVRRVREGYMLMLPKVVNLK